MNLVGMIIITVLVLGAVAGSFYIGKVFGYMKGVQEVMASLAGIDIKKIVKNEMKEFFGGKSE